MTRAEALAVVERLFAAFPDRHRPAGTKTIYVAHVEKLRDFDTAMKVAEGMESTASWLPPIALVEAAYREYRRSHPPPALPEPELTEEERRANVARVKLLQEKVAGKIGLPEALERLAELDGER